MLLGAALVLAVFAMFNRPWYEYSEWTLAGGVAPKVGGRAAQVFVRTKTPTNPIDPSHGYSVQEFGWGVTPGDVVLASEVCDVVEEILWKSRIAGDDDR